MIRTMKYLSICICLFLSACIQSPVFKAKEYALIKSNYPIIRLNGNDIAPSYQLDLKAGETSVVIVYHSYRYDYHCTFSWEVKPGTTYEVTDHEKKYPLTLYRWVRKNRFWANRLNPLDPLACSKKQTE